jgi:asparagine synthase (glutamine-hydrolysing)
MIIAGQACNDGIKVLLSGAGGDDIFSGYRRHQAIKTECLWSWLPEPLRRLAGRLASSHTQVRSPMVRRMVKVLSNAHLHPQQRLLSYYLWSSDELRQSLFTAEYAEEAFSCEVTRPLAEALQDIISENDPVNRSLFLDSRFFLPDHNLNYTDKTCMRYGVEARVPLLDPDFNLWQVYF